MRRRFWSEGGWHLLKAVETWTDLGHGFIELRRLKFGSARAYGSESEPTLPFIHDGCCRTTGAAVRLL